jgi:hypothetical protein
MIIITTKPWRKKYENRREYLSRKMGKSAFVVELIFSAPISSG